MKKQPYFWNSLVSAAGVFLYTGVVAWFLFNSQKLFNNKPDNFFMPLFMLLLLIVSATITGLLVLGKPIQLYLNGLKKEAIELLVFTLVWLILFAVLVIFLLLL